MREAQEQQQKYYNRGRRELTFEIGDRVLISTENMAPAQIGAPSRKLMPHRIGPYEITGKRNDNSYEVDIPSAMKMPGEFNIQYLEPY